MLEQIKTVTIAVLVTGIVAFACGIHYGQTTPAAHASTAIAQTSK